MWYVVEAKPDASLYYGVNRDVSREEFRKAIDDETVCGLLKKVKVKKGDVFFIEPGTIHAIGAGIVIAEIQQSSDVTYRVFDYGRVDKDGQLRELHIKQACEVASLCVSKTDYNFENHLAKCRYFTADYVKVKGVRQIFTDGSTFYSLLILDGRLKVKNGSKLIDASKGDSIYVGASIGKTLLAGDAKMLVTYVESQ